MSENLEFFFSSRDEWREWLENNHDKSNGIWVIYFKKHTKQKSLTYNEGVEEALCFGWIDSLVKTVDSERYKQKYTPRKKSSVWSIINKKRVEKMIKEGKMTEAGLKLIEVAKKNGNWDKAYGAREKPTIPDDLIQALKKNKKAYENFMSFAPSHQTTYVFWLNNAKREETRKKRMNQIVQFAEQKIKPGML